MSNYRDLAERILSEHVDDLTAWLEAHTKWIRNQHGENTTILLRRDRNNFTLDDPEWHYANFSLELVYGNEAL